MAGWPTDTPTQCWRVVKNGQIRFAKGIFTAPEITYKSGKYIRVFTTSDFVVMGYLSDDGITPFEHDHPSWYNDGFELKRRI